MTVTEFATVKLKDGVTWPDIITYFREGVRAQSKASGYKLHVFDDADLPGTIYLLSKWESVAANKAWHGHESNKEVMIGLAPLMNVERVLHSTVTFDSALDNVRELYFIEAPGEPTEVPEEAGHRALWNATGIDVEGKTTKSHRFLGFEQPLENEAHFKWAADMRRMRRHDDI